MSKEKSEYQKVLDLLNEYEDPMISRYEKYDEETGFFILNTWQKAREEVILGKTYWFIEWLVESEKIDLYKLPIRLEEYYQNTEAVGYITDDESILLMELAIQDEPISFLISILK